MFTSKSFFYTVNILWCDLWGMKLNASKTNTIYDILQFRHNASSVTPINYWRNSTEGVWWPCYIWSNIWFQDAFEKHLRSVSRTASQRLGILRKSWRVFDDRSLLGRCFGVLPCPFWSAVLQCGARLPIHTLNYSTVLSVVPGSYWVCVWL